MVTFALTIGAGVNSNRDFGAKFSVLGHAELSNAGRFHKFYDRNKSHEPIMNYRESIS